MESCSYYNSIYKDFRFLDSSYNKLQQIDYLLQIIDKEMATVPYGIENVPFFIMTNKMLEEYEANKKLKHVNIIDAYFISTAIYSEFYGNYKETVDNLKQNYAQFLFRNASIQNTELKQNTISKISMNLLGIENWLKQQESKRKAEIDNDEGNSKLEQEKVLQKEPQNKEEQLVENNKENEQSAVEGLKSQEIINHVTKVVLEENKTIINAKLSDETKTEFLKKDVGKTEIEQEILDQLNKDNISVKEKQLLFNNCDMGEKNQENREQGYHNIDDSLIKCQGKVQSMLDMVKDLQSELYEQFIRKIAFVEIGNYNAIFDLYNNIVKTQQMNDNRECSVVMSNYKQLMNRIESTLHGLNIEIIKSDIGTVVNENLHTVVNANSINKSQKMTVKKSIKPGFIYKDTALLKEEVEAIDNEI